MIYSPRPLCMVCLGEHYYPEGKPQGPSFPSYQHRYTDRLGYHFWIAYTQPQIDANMARNGGVFTPYLPIKISYSTPQ